MDKNLGIVVACLFDNMQLANYVLALEDRKKSDSNPSRIFSVHKSAFTLPPEFRNEELTVRKNLQRRVERPLLFGDCIEWKSGNRQNDNSDYIMSFDRVSKRFESRCKDGKSQIKVDGCFDPKNPRRFWSLSFPNVYVARSNEAVALPNVYLSAWIQIEIDDDKVCHFDLDEIECICEPSDQGNVASAPWNISTNKYNTVTMFDLDDDEDDFGFTDNNIINNQPKQVLYNVIGFAVDSKSFFVDTLPQYKFSFVFFNEPAVSGSYYKLEAIWNRFDNYYMVNKALMKKDLNNFKIDGTGRIRTSVKTYEHAGIFETAKLGLLDDPLKKLAMLHLSPYASSSFMVAVEDGDPYHKFRFRIIDIIDPKDRLNNYLHAEEKITLNDLPGVVISEKQVFCSLHGPLVFKAPSSMTLSAIGSHIKFDATYNPLKNVFELEDWRKIEITEDVTHVKRGEYQCIFKIKARRNPHKDFIGFLNSEDFGLIDARDLVDTTSKPVFDVWISYTESNENGVRVARTPFKVVSIQTNPEDALSKLAPVEPPEPVHETRFDTVHMTNNTNIPEEDPAASAEPITSTVSVHSNLDMFRYNDPFFPSSSIPQRRFENSTALMNQRLLSHRMAYSSSIQTDDQLSYRSSMYNDGLRTPVSMVPSNNSYSTEAEQTFADYKQIVDSHPLHADCKNTCDTECSFINAMIELITQNGRFYKKLRQHFPEIAKDLKFRITAVCQSNESDS